MANDFDYLHIKGRTEGSSNELSLDVLDAARSNLDSKKSRRTRRSAGLPGFFPIPRRARAHKGKPAAHAEPSGATGAFGREASGQVRPGTQPRPSAASSGRTSHKASGDSALASVPEVARRKQARRSSTLRRWALGVAVFALIVGLGSFFGYRFYQQRIDFNGRFVSLVDQVVEIDQTLVNVDIKMKDPLSSTADDIERVLDEIPAMQAQLEQVIADARAMMSDRDGDDIAALNEVVGAAQARKGLLDSAEDALESVQRIDGKVAQANAAWNKVLDADQTARNAATLANNASTAEETTAARDMTNAAIDQMNEAVQALDELAEANEGLSLASQKEYLEKRVKALGYAVQTSDALLANDRQAATEANNSYNATEREAASMVGSLPASLGDEVVGLYRDQVAERVEEYREERAHVTEVDSTLRARLP